MLAPAAGTPDAPAEPALLADAVGDVFAFTVEVAHPGGELLWRYFGPNSHVIFGVAQTRDRSLPDLLEDHVHPDDVPAAAELVAALCRGAGVDTELRVCGDDDVMRWVHWRGLPRWGEDRLLIDAVATDVSARRRLATRHAAVDERERQYAARIDTARDHALLVREANDNVLQRLFAARLRLEMLRRKLDDPEAHAVSTIEFQLEQASTDLREVIRGLSDVLDDVLSDEPDLPETA